VTSGPAGDRGNIGRSLTKNLTPSAARRRRTHHRQSQPLPEQRRVAEGFGYRDITTAVGTNNFCAAALLGLSVEQIRVTIVAAYQEKFCAAKNQKMKCDAQIGTRKLAHKLLF